MRAGSGRRGIARAAGFTYLVMLFAVASASAIAAAGSVVWHHEAQRDRERELLRIGAEFRRAIGAYYQRPPGSVKTYPPSLEQLLRDDRHLTLHRYLRRLYRDPVTGKAEWGVVHAPGGGIMGVYSLSEAAPVKTGGFEGEDAFFNGKTHYTDWKFVYTPPENDAATPAMPPSRAPPRSSRKP